MLAGFLDDQISILLGQLPELGIASKSGLDSGQFVGGNIPRVILAILPTLEFVIGARGVRTLLKGIPGKLSPLHGGNARNLLQKVCFCGLIHNVPITLGTHA